MVTNRIRALRKEAGYSQKELGNVLGVGQTTVSAWEIGRNEPDNESSHKMAKLFGCSIGYLMGYEAESKHRGLSDAEWEAFIHQKRLEHMEEQIQAQIQREINGIDPEIEEYLAEQESDERIRNWELDGRRIFPESIEIDAILDRTTAEGRKRAVKVIELMFPYAGE